MSDTPSAAPPPPEDRGPAGTTPVPEQGHAREHGPGPADVPAPTSGAGRETGARSAKASETGAGPAPGTVPVATSVGQAGPPRQRAGATPSGGPVAHGPGGAVAQPPRTPPPPSLGRFAALRPADPSPVTAPTLWGVLATGLLSALLLDEGPGPNVLIVAVPAILAASFAARASGRRLRPWTLVWAVGGLALLAVPALNDAGRPTFLALVSALVLTSFALHGGGGWPSILFGPVGLVDSLGAGTSWVWRGVRDRAGASRGRWGPVLRTTGVALVLLVVFGALFAGADAAFADLLGSMIPDASPVQAPWRLSFFLLGIGGAVAVARTAAAPLRWDRTVIAPGRARGRLEWALPLLVMNLLFAAFNAVQLAVLFGGYDKVLSETGLTYAQYARQGFWQLLTATLLTLVVIAFALRWAPHSGRRDVSLVRAVLGTLCVPTLVVVASALRRMDLYVDAYGLTRLRVSVAAMEMWLGLVLLLIMVAGVFGARLLSRALAVSAALAVLVFGLVSPDALVAERNVERYDRLGKIDLRYLQGLSADAVPALDELPEPQRSCALKEIEARLREDDGHRYATSRSEARARAILAARGIDPNPGTCVGAVPREDFLPSGQDDQFGAS
ncbi:DUF4153 domain-containing protein [Streptomyces sp. NPDC048577]|uniref:DUF4153 domain-containing protein n=1 Tax=Streptomyces sp. NPDC048577 TaxID=3157209 RepID=UPI0034139BDF